MGQLHFDLEEFQQAATTFRRDLLVMPLFALRDTTQHMTIMTGVTTPQLLGEKAIRGAEFAPYKANRKTDLDLDLKLRQIVTYFGSLNGEFDPNEAIQTLLGHRASQAMDGQLASALTAKEVLSLIAKQAGAILHDHLWDAVRNPSGTQTKDLFNGFDTITKAEIADGTISEDNGNLIDLGDEITVDNVLDIFDYILDTMHPKLRAQQSKIYTSQRIYDLYSRAYKKANHGIPYNTKFDQPTIEGSKGNLVLLPLQSKTGSNFMHITTKSNLIVGVDQESDAERVTVKDYAPDTLTFMMRMFFGEQFRSIDPTQMLTVKFNGTQAITKPTGAAQASIPESSAAAQHIEVETNLAKVSDVSD